MYIRVNGVPFCESGSSYLIFRRIDDALPETIGDYPNNVFICEPANLTHAEVMVEFLGRNGDTIQLAMGTCPAYEARRIEEQAERNAENFGGKKENG